MKNPSTLELSACFIASLVYSFTAGSVARGMENVHPGNIVAREDTSSSPSFCKAQPENIEYCLDSEGIETITSPQECSEVLGAGGNVFTSSRKKLLGKCNGAGMPVRTGSERNNNFLLFSTALGVKSPKDRTELALPKYYKFGKDLYFSFDIRVPPNSPHTSEFLYVVQFWQCPGLSPIVGLRLTRGTSSQLALVVRGEGSSASSNNAAIARIPLGEAKWNQVALRVRPGLEKSGSVEMWANGQKVGKWQKTIGFNPGSACRNNPAVTSYRVKFGIYKGNEPDRSHTFHFDNIILSTKKPNIVVFD